MPLSSSLVLEFGALKHNHRQKQRDSLLLSAARGAGGLEVPPQCGPGTEEVGLWGVGEVTPVTVSHR